MTNTHRTEPADFRELGIVRALLASAEACEWFADMGISAEALFTDKRCATLAHWAMGGCKGTPPVVTESLEQTQDGRYSLGQWLANSMETTAADPRTGAPAVEHYRAEWALRDAQRYCLEFAGRWFPTYLRDQAAYIDKRIGEKVALLELAEVGRHHRKLLDYIAQGDAA